MADESSTSVKPGGDDGGAPLAGMHLRAIRLQNDLSLEQLAAELHVDVATLEAVEENRFQDLGAPVFAKGHLKKYAVALGVSAEEILAEYYQTHKATEMPPIVAGPSQRHWFNLGRGTGLLVAVIGLASLMLWWALRDDAPAELTPAPPIVPPATSKAGSDAGELTTTSTEPFVVEQRPPERSAAPTPDDAAAPAESSATLALEFQGECWVEIRDADGRRIFSGTGRAGQRRSASGKLPFQVVIGDASVVSLSLNERPYEIPAGARRGRTARLVIPAN